MPWPAHRGREAAGSCRRAAAPLGCLTVPPRVTGARGMRMDMSGPSPSPAPQWLRSEAVIAGRLLVIAAAVGALLWAALQVTVVSVAVFLGFAQAALLWPLDRVLRRFLPRVIAALICVVLYLCAFLAMAWFITKEMISTWPDLVQAGIGGIKSANEWALDQGWKVPNDLASNLEAQLQERVGTIVSGVGNAALSTLSTAATLVTTLVLATFLTLFALTSGDQLWDSFCRSLPSRLRPRASASFRAAFKSARAWMWASTLTGLVDGVFIGLGLAWLGIPLAIPIGALTFVLGYIPMVGATIAGMVAVIVALFFGGPSAAIWALLIVVIVQQVEGNVLSPLLLSKAMDFNPIITLLLASVGGAALGIVGLFLAVPTAGIITAAVKAWRSTEPASAQASDTEHPAPAAPADAAAAAAGATIAADA